MSDYIKRDWQRGMPYSEMHKKYGPFKGCECDECEQWRDLERLDEQMETDEARDK